MTAEELLRRALIEAQWRQLSRSAKVARVLGNLVRLVVPWVVAGLLAWVAIHFIVKFW